MVITPEVHREFEVERLRIMQYGLAPAGSEQDVIRAFLDTHTAGIYDERLPCLSAADVVIREYAFRYGRADLVLFHQDGTASVIEAKDGAKGYTHVVGGIGQCSLYATQLSTRSGALKAVRRCLLWSSAGLMEDIAIEDACVLAGVVPLMYPSVRTLTACRLAVATVLSREVAHGRA